MRSRTIAIATSIAALSFAAVPIAQAATSTHHAAKTVNVDRSRDASGVRHVDRSPDPRSADRNSRDVGSADTQRDR
jgi:Ni/Co efflux regulator RcnB